MVPGPILAGWAPVRHLRTSRRQCGAAEAALGEQAKTTATGTGAAPSASSSPLPPGSAAAPLSAPAPQADGFDLLAAAEIAAARDPLGAAQRQAAAANRAAAVAGPQEQGRPEDDEDAAEAALEEQAKTELGILRRACV